MASLTAPETRGEGTRSKWCSGYFTGRTCGVMSCLPLSRHQSPSGLDVSSKEFRVRFAPFLFTLGIYILPRYLYYQSFGIDACFRFKRRQISSYQKDPELGPGFAYIVSWEPYSQYLLDNANQSDVSGVPVLFVHSSQQFSG